MWWIQLVACDDTLLNSGNGENPIGANVPTYYQDVLPILENHCVSCHAPGQIGPFPLLTYEEASVFAAPMAASVSSGSMPPWPPSPDCNSYFNERRLSDAEIDTLSRWADGGAPAGDSERPVHGEGTALGLSRVDFEIPIPLPYTPPADPNDDYRCFLLPIASPQDLYLTGFGVIPGNASIVHHVIAYLALPELIPTYEALDDAEIGPGWTCFGGPGGSIQTDAAWLGGWVPGSLGDNYPQGTGILVPQGSSAVVQIHYNTDFVEPTPDQTTLQISVEASVDSQATLVKWYDPAWVQDGTMTIPAGEPDVVHTFEAGNPVGRDAFVWAVGLHEHLLGASAALTAIEPSGAEKCMLQIDDWDFHWQGNYFLQQPIPISADDRVRIECHFDNSAENQPGVTPRDVNWGENSTEEMCLGIVYATLQ